MDDPIKGVKPEGEAETTPTTTPVVEETTDIATAAPEEGKKGFDNRLGELEQREKTAKIRAAAAAAKLAEAEAVSLEHKMAELTRGERDQGFNPLNNPPQIVKEGEELTAPELNNRITSVLQMQEMQHQRERAQDRIERESSEVVSKYDKLNPESDNFDPELSKWVSDTVFEMGKNNMNISVKKIVQGLMKPYQSQASKEVKAQTENIAKQVSESAIRPSNAKPAEKKFEDLTLEEMEQKLGYAQG
jgi:hypothetical protein